MIVQGKYKTGVYVGEELERKDDRTLIKVLAVLKHPLQGDLHQGFETEVPLFHERNALSYYEKTWVPTVTVQPYEEDIPDYKTSLRTALDNEKEKMKAREDEFGEKALNSLESLETRYKFD
ncbi:kinase-associated lipoprotein B [Natribacillus halophilus]|uniref:Kinase-associated protein B n=1 Tax=Natribacillus halophilus TaxID=549003 RepID=A0A1G8J8C2_9BACI|nr:kinase-associated lipoprotein B [Natribacillus halophilus]SDI27436.1 kinase-associated protein B [Natribacillus halophilus]